MQDKILLIFALYLAVISYDILLSGTLYSQPNSPIEWSRSKKVVVGWLERSI